ncbi:MAG: restriction endonuclease subunit S [Myxococcales bacterium]|nr:restriction endonuclease subunit S [Myxococcales bacterium]
MTNNSIILTEIADVFNGKTPSKMEQRESGHPVLKIKDISADGVFSGNFTSFVDKEFFDKYSLKTIEANDTLILNAAHNANYVGSKQYKATEEVTGSIATGEWLIVRAKKGKVSPDYLHFFFRANKTIHAIKGLVKGIHLYPKDVCRLKIPFHSLPEQARIASVLEETDMVRHTRKQSIKLLDDFLRSTFLEMFGDPELNDRLWDAKMFSELGNLDRGKSKHRPRNAPELLGGPYPLVQTGDVANSNGYIKSYNQTYSEIGLKQSKLWPVGTLCITIAANIAKTGILTFEACFPDSVVGFSPSSSVRTEYIQMWLSFLQKSIEDKAPESAQKNINLKILRELRVPTPPIDLQNKFAAIVGQVESTKQKMKESLEQMNNCFNALMQRYFG